MKVFLFTTFFTSLCLAIGTARVDFVFLAEESTLHKELNHTKEMAIFEETIFKILEKEDVPLPRIHYHNSIYLEGAVASAVCAARDKDGDDSVFEEIVGICDVYILPCNVNIDDRDLIRDIAIHESAHLVVNHTYGSISDLDKMHGLRWRRVVRRYGGSTDKSIYASESCKK